MGCSAMDATAPVWTLEVGHISSGTRRSRTYAASRPSVNRPSGVHLDVVDDAHAVAQALRAAPLERLPDGRQAECLAGVDGHVEVGAMDELEGVQVAAGREAGLGPRDVEAHHARVAVATASSAISTERANWRMAVTMARIDDRAPGRLRRGLPRRKPVQPGLHHLVEGEPAWVDSSGA